MNYKTCKIYQSEPRRLLFGHIEIADSFPKKLLGLMHKPEPAEGEGMLLTRTRAIHMIGMTHPLDILFLNRNGEIVKLRPELSPWQYVSEKKAESTLEVAAGTIDHYGLKQGMKLEIQHEQ